MTQLSFMLLTFKTFWIVFYELHIFSLGKWSSPRFTIGDNHCNRYRYSWGMAVLKIGMQLLWWSENNNFGLSPCKKDLRARALRPKTTRTMDLYTSHVYCTEYTKNIQYAIAKNIKCNTKGYCIKHNVRVGTGTVITVHFLVNTTYVH
jgi:hypothetical protein